MSDIFPPGIGQIVWWFDGVDLSPNAAIVAYAYDEHTVNLAAFNSSASLVPLRSQKFAHPGEPKPSGPYATWAGTDLDDAPLTDGGAISMASSEVETQKDMTATEAARLPPAETEEPPIPGLED